MIKPSPLQRIALALTVLALASAAMADPTSKRQKQLDRALGTSLYKGDVAGAAEALRKGANPNTYDTHFYAGKQPLILLLLESTARGKVRLQLAALLLSWGANPNQRTRSDTAVHLAHHLGDEDYRAMIDLLVAKGADINQRGWRGETPLHQAACFGRTEQMAVLLSHNADVRAKDAYGRTPRQVAADFGHLNEYQRAQARSRWLLVARRAALKRAMDLKPENRDRSRQSRKRARR